VKSHPNVVRTLDVGLEDDRLFLVMELLEGRTLAQLEHRQLPCEAVAGIAVQVLAALEHLQEAKAPNGAPLKLVHRDVKPSNLFITKEGVVKLIDFGLASARGVGAETTTSGTIRGTVAYLSPEQARGQRPEPKSDVFSLGVVLHELLTGRRLFDQDAVAAQLSAILFGALPPVSSVRSDVPAAFDAAVMRALARDVAVRPSPEELQRLLREAIAPAEAWTPTDLAVWLQTQRLPPSGALTTTSLPGPASETTRTEMTGTAAQGVSKLQRRLFAAVMALVAVLAIAVVVRVVMRAAAVGAPAPVAEVTGTEGDAPPPPAPPPPAEVPGEEDADDDVEEPEAAAAPDAQPVRKKRARRTGPRPTVLTTIDSRPWSYVSIDGKSLGATPLVKVPLPAGTHHLEAVDESGRKKSMKVRLVEGREEKILVEW
jgi:serine/threonine-protein kinase